MNLNTALKNMAASEHNVTVMALFAKMFPNGNFGESAQSRIIKILELGGQPSEELIRTAKNQEQIGVPTNKMLGDYHLTDAELIRIGKTFFNSIRAFSARKNKGINVDCPYYKLSVEIEERYNTIVLEQNFTKSKYALDSAASGVRFAEQKLYNLKREHENQLKSFLAQYPNYPAYAALMELAQFANNIKITKNSFFNRSLCNLNHSNCDCFDD